MLKENLEHVEARIQKACDRAGRDRGEVTLIAVSKTKPADTLREAYDLGVRVFGENKVQELVDKYEVLPDDISWHMIGHLQRNKVKYMIDKAELIHSVDSLRLAETINLITYFWTVRLESNKGSKMPSQGQTVQSSSRRQKYLLSGMPTG